MTTGINVTVAEKRLRVKYPSADKFATYFRKIPRWVVLLIVLLLFGRFVLILIFHLLS